MTARALPFFVGTESPRHIAFFYWVRGPYLVLEELSQLKPVGYFEDRSTIPLAVSGDSYLEGNEIAPFDAITTCSESHRPEPSGRITECQ